MPAVFHTSLLEWQNSTIPIWAIRKNVILRNVINLLKFMAKFVLQQHSPIKHLVTTLVVFVGGPAIIHGIIQAYYRLAVCTDSCTLQTGST